jgi:hypothetical protein
LCFRHSPFWPLFPVTEGEDFLCLQTIKKEHPMTTSRIMILSAVLALAIPSVSAMAQDGWGASYSFGPSTSRITYAKTTLEPGHFPPVSNNIGPLFLWPGMSNGQGDLIQTTMDAYPDNSWCGATSGQWCVETSDFGSFGQYNGAAYPINYNDLVTIEYKLEPDGQTWDQIVTSKQAGKVVSYFSYSDGPLQGTGFGFATEADANSFTIDKQYYVNTEFHFAAADPHFGSTGVGGVGAAYGATGTGTGIGTAENLRTTDDGLTWQVDLITLPPMTQQGPQITAPAVSTCRPTLVTPYIQVEDEGWQANSTVTVSSGTSVSLGPQPVKEGSWKWFGAASGTARQITVAPTTSGTNTYIAQYTNSCGTFSSQMFRVVVK